MAAVDNKKPTPEESFRDSLKDVILVAEKLSSHCRNLEEMIGILQLAMDNDAQLKILMNLVTGR